MKVLFDTNVLLDFALARKPFAEASLRAWSTVSCSGEKPCLAPHSLATFYYMVRQSRGNETATQSVNDLLDTGRVVGFDAETADLSRSLGFKDFEDAMVAAAAVQADAELILTRNGTDFRNSPIPFRTPEGFLAGG